MNDSPEKKCPKLCAKHALLKAAEELFTRHAYSAVSTRDIAEAAGVNLGAIQYYFSSKSQLFVEAVRALIARYWRTEDFLEFLSEVPATRESAASQLCTFIYMMIHEMFYPRIPDACRILYREILGNAAEDTEMFEALISSTIKEFGEPLHNQLAQILQKICPKASDLEINLQIQSIMGQCTHYFINRPILGRMKIIEFSEQQDFKRAVEHVCRFTLRAIGCGEGIIGKSLLKILELETQNS